MLLRKLVHASKPMFDLLWEQQAKKTPAAFWNQSHNSIYILSSFLVHKSVPAVSNPDWSLIAQICFVCVYTASCASSQRLCIVMLGHLCICVWFLCVYQRNSPSQYYEEVQAVPCVSKVTLLAKNPQSHHLDYHLNGKECKDEVIKVLQIETDRRYKSALWCKTHKL